MKYKHIDQNIDLKETEIIKEQARNLLNKPFKVKCNFCIIN